MNYIKLFHYSTYPNLTQIDPAYFGTGVTRGSECKQGKSGLDKSYFYIQDKPEVCVKSKNRYELYMPADWVDLIYDIGTDSLHLREYCIEQYRAKHHVDPYSHVLWEEMEKLIHQLGYKGWRNSQFTQLPHCLVLFHTLSTSVPHDLENSYLWDDYQLATRKHRRHSRSMSLPTFFTSKNMRRVTDENESWNSMKLI